MNNLEKATTATRPADSAQVRGHEPLQRMTPPVDVYENDDELLLLVDLPGVKGDSIDVKLEPPRLSIEARQASEPLAAWGILGSRFERTFLVPDGLDSEKVEAKMDHGVLHIHLKKSERIKPRRINVQGE